MGTLIGILSPQHRRCCEEPIGVTVRLRGPVGRGATITELDPRLIPPGVPPSLSITEVFPTFGEARQASEEPFKRCEHRFTPPPSDARGVGSGRLVAPPSPTHDSGRAGAQTALISEVDARGPAGEPPGAARAAVSGRPGEACRANSALTPLTARCWHSVLTPLFSQVLAHMPSMNKVLVF